VPQNQDKDNSKLRKSSPSSLRSLPPSKGDFYLFRPRGPGNKPHLINQRRFRWKTLPESNKWRCCRWFGS